MKTSHLILSKEIEKNISKNKYYSTEQFVSDCQAYIKAIKEGRMLCVIKSVSASGMSRVIKFNSCEVGKERSNYRQYLSMFEALGYKENRNQNGFRISGCGMDMIFHTNYSIMHTLHRIGLIDKKECEHLAQQTPVVL